MKAQILQTKLIPPPKTPDQITREELLKVIFDDSLIKDKFTRPITLIAAQPGYGKTSLLIDCINYIEDIDNRYVWLTVSIEDNSPLNFLIYLLAAIKNIEEDFAPKANEYLSAIKEQGFDRDNQKQLFQELLLYFLNQLTMLEKPIFIILDELENIASPEFGQLFKFLIDNLPVSIHVIAASRQLNNLPVSTWQSTGKVKLLKSKDLSFDFNEALKFFRNQNISISKEHIQAAYKIVDGWAAGLMLISSIMDSKTIDQILNDELPSGVEQIYDYLLDEVLAGIPEELENFLMMTAPLYKFNLELVKFITGDNNSLEFINKLLKKQLFLQKLPGQANWYKYQSVFARALENKLYIEKPVLKEEIIYKAADWFNNRGMIVEAIEQLLKDGYYSRASSILFQNLGKLVSQGKIFALKNWLSRFPSRMVQRKAKLEIIEILTQVMDGHYEEAFEGLETIREKIKTGQLDEIAADQVEMIEGLSEIFEMVIASHMNKELNIDGNIQETFSKLGQDQYFLQFAGILYGNEMLVKGDIDKALEVYGSIRSSGYSYQLARIKEAYIYWYRGDLNKTIQTVDKIIYANDDKSEEFISITAFAKIIKSIIFVERNLLNKAEKQFSSNYKIIDRVAEKSIKLITNIFRLNYYLSIGDLDQASLIEEKLMQLKSKMNMEFLNYHINSLQARLWLISDHSKHRNWREVKKFIEEQGVNLNAEFQLFRDEEFISLSRALIQGEKYNEAEDLLKGLIEFSAANKLSRTELKARLLLTIIYHQIDSNQAALKQIQAALDIALERGFFRSIIEEGEPLIGILRVYLNQKTLDSEYLEFIKKLITDKSVNNDSKDPLKEQPLIEPLSQRELEILTEIAAGKTNQQIADKLFISANTVKWHTSNIYGKMNASNRTEAVDIAREMEII